MTDRNDRRLREGGISIDYTSGIVAVELTDGEDLIGLNGLTYADLTIEEGTGDHAGDTIISETASGDVLMILDNVVANLIDGNDFTTVADDWWLG